MKRYVLLALVVGGCSTSTDTTAPHTGTLTVTVTAPSGLTTSVTITGPGGFTKTITSTTMLTGVAPGSYTIAAADVPIPDSVVSSVYAATITGSPAVVSVGTTAAVTVAFAKRPGSGGLWIVGGTDVGPNTVASASQYTAAQLRTSSSVAPAVALTFPMTTGPNTNANGLAFDARGDLWVVNDNTNTVVEYKTADLGTTGSPTAAVTIQLTHANYADGLAFDANGDLWVLNQDSSTVAEFTPDQLQASGSPTPTVTITIKVNGSFGDPLAIAFDAQGSLWVVTGQYLAKYTASQLATSGTPVPAVSIVPPFGFPYYAAFDKAGNLWLANASYGVDSGGITTNVPGWISEIAAASLAASGSVSNVVTWHLPAGNYVAWPTALAFDASGDLWYTDAFNARVGEFTAAQLTAGGTPLPTITIVSTTPAILTDLAFDPHTTAVPLH